MKLLTAVIRPARLSSVTDALEAAGFEPMMVASVQTSAQSPPGLTYRGVRYAGPSVVLVELLVDSKEAERAAHVISRANDSGTGEGEEVRMWAMEVMHPFGPTGPPARQRRSMTASMTASASASAS